MDDNRQRAWNAIVRAGYSERLTKTGLNAIRKAGRDLGLTATDMQHIEVALEYRRDSGLLYERWSNVPKFKERSA